MFKRMKGQTTGKELLHSLLDLSNRGALFMNKCVSITTDGARSMTGVNIGMISLLKQHLGERKTELLNITVLYTNKICVLKYWVLSS